MLKGKGYFFQILSLGSGHARTMISAMNTTTDKVLKKWPTCPLNILNMLIKQSSML